MLVIQLKFSYLTIKCVSRPWKQKWLSAREVGKFLRKKNLQLCTEQEWGATRSHNKAIYLPNKNAYTVYTVRTTVWILPGKMLCEKRVRWTSRLHGKWTIIVCIVTRSDIVRGSRPPRLQQLNIHIDFYPIEKNTIVCTLLYVKYDCTSQQVPQHVIIIWIQARRPLLLHLHSRTIWTLIFFFLATPAPLDTFSINSFTF